MRRDDVMQAASPAIRVLVTEDVSADAELELRELRRAGMRVNSLVVETEEAFTRALVEFAPDVILSDFSMPGFDGMAALSLARTVSPHTPFVFVSGTIGEEYAIRALKSGATDYVLKTNLVRLPAAVERALLEAKDRRDRRRMEAELEAARERLASIIDSLPDMLWSVEMPSENILYVSPTSKEIFGRDPEDFVSEPDLWIEVVHPEDRALMVEAWRRMTVEGRPFDIEYRIVRRDGSHRWVNDRGHVVRGTDGTTVRVDGVVRDITVQVGDRLRIARMSRIRDIGSDVNAALVRLRDRKALFDEFCRIAVSRGGFVLARIVELDAANHARIAVTTEADPSEFQKVVDRFNADKGRDDSLLAQALRSGQPMVSDDAADDSRVKNRAELTRQGNLSLALLPLIEENRAAGLVILRAREPQFFDQEELHLLAEMVSNISIALESIGKQARLAYLAHYDTLTELPNRTLFHERLTLAVESARKAKGALALVLIDLERFKAINDTLGQRGGDHVLREMALRLKAAAAGDVNRVARLGGNLFAIVIQETRGADDVAARLEQKIALLTAPIDTDDREIRLAAKSGIAAFPQDGADADTLFRNAEAALKRAKETGERHVFYAPHINARLAEQVELEHRLRKAVEGGELFLHYQPKVELATRRIVGLEALMRWLGPDGMPVSPVRFVPVLEQTGLIVEAGRQAITAASAAFRAWRKLGLEVPRIAVNVSALQLRRASFVSDVRGALDTSGTDGGGVDLEITESLLMTEVDDSIRKLRELRGMGLRIALDDFGTGYSSLAYLSKLPVDSLKIDRAFIHAMTENVDDTSIISTIITLAQSLRLNVVAEGVETEQQAQLLRLLRCDQAQGYLFSPPVPAERVAALLETVSA